MINWRGRRERCGEKMRDTERKWGADGNRRGGAKRKDRKSFATKTREKEKGQTGLRHSTQLVFFPFLFANQA